MWFCNFHENVKHGVGQNRNKQPYSSAPRSACISVFFNQLCINTLEGRHFDAARPKRCSRTMASSIFMIYFRECESCNYLFLASTSCYQKQAMTKNYAARSSPYSFFLPIYRLHGFMVSRLSCGLFSRGLHIEVIVMSNSFVMFFCYDIPVFAQRHGCCVKWKSVNHSPMGCCILHSFFNINHVDIVWICFVR